MKPEITYITRDCAAHHIMHISIQKYLKYASWFAKTNKLNTHAWWISHSTKKHAKQYDATITDKSSNGTLDDITGCIASLFFYAIFISDYADNINEGIKTCGYIINTLKMMAKCMQALNYKGKTKVKCAIMKCPAPTGAPLDARKELVNILSK